LNRVLDIIKRLKSVDDAIKLLKTQVEFNSKIEKALDFAIKAHEGQKRKSGEPYVIHPILVAAITASISGDEIMVISALLHDVVEDTPVTIEEIEKEFGNDVKVIVEGLTKIVEIRDKKLAPSSSNEKLRTSALTFRKILIASIQDVRVLVVKLCDRLHNMLTLDALPRKKQLRISEETLVVYAPIAHRLGISKIKNQLEDLSFRYIYPEEYKKIDDYLKKHDQSLHIKLNSFVSKVKNILGNYGFHKDDIEISGRVKHHYSIYMKMQRKGIGIDEVLDLLAVRIIVNDPIECYRVLGALHLNFTPIISRFKDYIALPKENGYKTIHTTLLEKGGNWIVEAQIRTTKMHHLAEYGIAAHWKYKEGSGEDVNLDWLKNLAYRDDSAEDFLNEAKRDLFVEDVIVYSPKGRRFTLPKGSVALDFAYAVHSEIGDRAYSAFINKKRASLLTILKNGDIVKIQTANEPILHCSWIDTVKTSRARDGIKYRCNQRYKEVNELSAYNILGTIFDKSPEEIKNILKNINSKASIEKVPVVLDTLKEKIFKIAKHEKLPEVRPWEVFKRGYKKPYLKKMDRFNLFSNQHIDKIEFDYCCHPKVGDAIVGFYQNGVVVIHHKLCKKAYEKIKSGSKMVFIEWASSKFLRYRLIVALQNQKGILAKLLTKISDMGLNIIGIEMGIYRSDKAEYCRIDVESEKLNKKDIKQRLNKSFKLIDIVPLDDAYDKK